MVKNKKKSKPKKKTPEQEREWNIRYYLHYITEALQLTTKQYEAFEIMADHVIGGQTSINSKSSKFQELADWFEKNYEPLTDDEDYG